MLRPLLLALLLAPLQATAQDQPPLHIEITEGVIEPLRIALPAFADEGGAGPLAEEFRALGTRFLQMPIAEVGHVQAQPTRVSPA